MSLLVGAGWLRRILLAAFLAITLLFDTPVPFAAYAPFVAGVAGACTVALVAARGRGWMWPGYLVFLAGVAWSAAVSGVPGVWGAFLEQVWFVVLLWSVADEARETNDGGEGSRTAAWMAGLLVGLALLLPQLAGPRSVFDFGRPYHYLAVRQWSGYPEIGLLCVMGGGAAWALALVTRDRWLRAAAIILAAAFALGTMFLQARAAVLVLAVVLAWTAAVAAWRWRSWLGAALVASGLIVGAAVAWRAPDLVERLTTASAVNTSGDRPVEMREAVWREAWRLARAHPWAGVGPGQFQRAYERAGGTGTPIHAHNIVLHVAAEYGLPTLICYLALWARLLWSTARAAARTRDGEVAWALHAMLLAFFLRSLLEHYLSGLETSLRMLCLLAFVFGLAECVATRGRPDQRASA